MNVWPVTRGSLVVFGLLSATAAGCAPAADPVEEAAPMVAEYTPPAFNPESRDLTKADIERMMDELSNWGRWGPTDQLGAANLITPAKRLEAIGLVLDRGLPALVVCADEAAPLKLLKDAPNWDLIAGAIVLAPLEKDSPHLARVRVLCGQEATLPAADLTQNLVHNPQAGILNMIDAVLQGATGSVRLDRNTGCGYAAELDFAGTR